MAKTRLLYLMLCLLAAALISCQPEKMKTYSVEYDYNYPVGAFKASIGNSTIFTNGQDILEVSVENNPKFFCYAVNKEVLCKFNIKVKVSADAAENYRSTTQKLKENMLNSGKNRSALPERLVYYVNDGKVEEEVLLINNLQNKSANIQSVVISGKGADEKAAQNDALKKSKQIVNMLIDRK
ncbi:hypothetical protein HY637_04480 [Candidatus Woesearchaeota archaeon]|nr:hypothetical protein [Candidatus Woesearchaeota archaeon]